MLAAVKHRYFGMFLAGISGGAVALALTACGHATVLKHHRLTVALLEYRLRPSHVVAGAGPLRITLENDGRLTHNFVLVRPHPTTTVITTASGPVTATTTVAGRTADIPPGRTTTLTVTLAPGRYRMASTVGTDAALGEQGTVTVTSKRTPSRRRSADARSFIIATSL